MRSIVVQKDECERLGPHYKMGSKEIRYDRHVAHEEKEVWPPQ